MHSPLQAPEEYLQLYEEVEDEDRRTYLAMVTAMDDVVGNVTESLKEAGMYENSVIIWFSDNGGPVSFGASNFPLRGTKEGFHLKIEFLNISLLSARVVHIIQVFESIFS